jgi:trimeric autotransporter adhesin
MSLPMRTKRRRLCPLHILCTVSTLTTLLFAMPFANAPIANADGREEGSHVEQIAPGNIATIRQQGARNTATVYQSATGVRSSGDDDRERERERGREREDDEREENSSHSAGNGLNRAGITQSGIDHNASIAQRGSDLEASITQTGDRNSAQITQDGSAHRAAVAQNGSNLAVDITQSGVGRSIEVNQSGSGNGMPIVIRQR